MNNNNNVHIEISGLSCSGRSTIAYMIKNMLETFGVDVGYVDQDCAMPFTTEQIARNLNNMTDSTIDNSLSVDIHTTTVLRNNW